LLFIVILIVTDFLIIDIININNFLKHKPPHRKANKAADDSCRGAQPPAGEN
jgi:hypothetical protein